MPGLVPGIHALHRLSVVKAWMAGTSPAMTNSVDSHPDKDYIPACRFHRGRIHEAF
jgi:hypothetical protein